MRLFANVIAALIALMASMAIALLAGCSSIPVIDNSPRMPASVRVETVSLSGSLGYFAYEGSQTSWTHGLQRRIQQDVEFTESALGAFGAGAERAYLFDLNKPQLQQIDYDSRQYHECDLLGCFEYGGRSRSVQPQSAVIDASRCPLEIQDSRITFEPAPAQDGTYPGAAHRFEWRIDYRDEQQREGSSRLHGVLWLTAMEQAKARAAEASFWQQYRKVTGVPWTALQPLVPWTPLALVQRYFLRTLDADAQARVVNASVLDTNQVAVAGTLEWQIAGPACDQTLPQWQREKQARALGTDNGADNEVDNGAPEQVPADGVESAGDFLSAIVAELSGGAGTGNEQNAQSSGNADDSGRNSETPATGRRVFTYQWQVKSLNWGNVSANQLSVPDGFEPGTRF